MKIVVLGMGNTILADDGVGIYVVREVGRRINREDVDIKETSLAGINLLELLSGYDKAIVVDAIRSGKKNPGDVLKLSPNDFEVSTHYASAHHINFSSALELGKRLGAELPKNIVIYAIEVLDTETFNEKCTTKEVEEVIPKVAKMIVDELS